MTLYICWLCLEGADRGISPQYRRNIYIEILQKWFSSHFSAIYLSRDIPEVTFRWNISQNKIIINSVRHRHGRRYCSYLFIAIIILKCICICIPTHVEAFIHTFSNIERFSPAGFDRIVRSLFNNVRIGTVVNAKYVVHIGLYRRLQLYAYTPWYVHMHIQKLNETVDIFGVLIFTCCGYWSNPFFI